MKRAKHAFFTALLATAAALAAPPAFGQAALYRMAMGEDPPASTRSANGEDDAQKKEEAPSSGGHITVVTSVNSCLEKLPPEDAAEIRGRYLKPYQECQRRLQALSVQKRRAGEDGKEPDSSGNKAAESPRNFIRVRKDPQPEKKPVIGLRGSNLPPENPPKSRPRDSYNR